jgi:hypothetical protein
MADSYHPAACAASTLFAADGSLTSAFKPNLKNRRLIHETESIVGFGLWLVVRNGLLRDGSGHCDRE